MKTQEIQLPESKLTPYQIKTYGPKEFTDKYGRKSWIKATVRHDDECRNGHNSFSITGESGPVGRGADCFGCLHDDIAKAFPKLEPFIKWHLTGTNGPMHYIPNALYWAGLSGFCDGKDNSPPREDYLKSTIVYGALPDDSLVDPMLLAKEGKLRPWLESRIPALMDAFKRDVEALGLTY